MKVWFVKSEILCTKQLDRDDKKSRKQKINKPALPGANISEMFFSHLDHVHSQWWHDTRSSVAQYEVPSHWFHSCGTIRGPVRHNTRSYAARYEVHCGTIQGPMRHNTRSSLAARYEVLDTKSRTKFFQFRWFLDPSGPNQLYQT